MGDANEMYLILKDLKDIIDKEGDGDILVTVNLPYQLVRRIGEAVQDA